MVTALTSLFTETPVRPYVAMTGEITLTGHVLPVGGIKEKVLAAKRSGVRVMILPAENEAHVRQDIPAHLRQGITFHFVRTIDEVLAHALGLTLLPRRAAATRGHRDTGTQPAVARPQ